MKKYLPKNNKKPRTAKGSTGFCFTGGDADRHNEIRQHPTKPAELLAAWAFK
jgi:hypothetical protein